MPTALTLALDAAARNRIEALWSALDAAGLGDPKLRAGHPPHLTLAVVAEEMAGADIALPVPRSLTLTHLGLFPAPSPVLFLAPRVTAALLEAQARAVAALDGLTLHDHWRPGAWVPHVTLAQAVSEAPRALAVLGSVDLPMVVGIEAVELVAFPPARVVARHRPA